MEEAQEGSSGAGVSSARGRIRRGERVAFGVPESPIVDVTLSISLRLSSVCVAVS
jgi:hypothetical protein